MNINHIAINCINITKIEQFFVKYFNAHNIANYHIPRTGLHSCMLSFDNGARLELMNWPDMEEHKQISKMQGLVHLSISVEKKKKVDELTKRFISDNYCCTSCPRTTGDGYYESCIIGEENLIIEITI